MSAAPRMISWSGMTHMGKVRKNNEDAFLAITFDAQTFRYLGKEGSISLDSGDCVFAVSDGMGGARAGEFASRIAVEKISWLLPKGFRSMAAGLSSGFADLFDELYAETHKAIVNLSQQYEECSGMGATLSLAWFTPDWMFFAHIGDSRIYYLPSGGGLRQISEDHSHVGWLFRNGKINEREARTHPLRHTINRALGADHQFVNPQVGAVGYEPGDLFLLCSDGLIDGLWDRQLLQLLRAPEKAEAALPPARRLVEAALERSGQDNITAVVVQV